jgi:hypothetical protein
MDRRKGVRSSAYSFEMGISSRLAREAGAMWPRVDAAIRSFLGGKLPADSVVSQGRRAPWVRGMSSISMAPALKVARRGNPLLPRLPLTRVFM